MSSASLWPGGWWWGLAFIDFRYFFPDELSSSLFGHRGQAPRSRQRGVFGKARREPTAFAWPWETFASLSCSLRFSSRSHRRANTLLCILLYFTASIWSNLKVLQGPVPGFISERSVRVKASAVYPRGKFKCQDTINTCYFSDMRRNRAA